jgi:uncharacterized membrane protein YfcA
MDTAALAVIVVSVLLASMVQTISGFGFALLSVPLMTLAINVHNAVVVSTLVGVMTTTVLAWRLRSHADRVLTRRLAVGAYAGMPIGLAIFTAVGERTLLRLLGAAVVMAVILLMAGLDLRSRGRSVELAAGFVAGVLGTSVSTNGPPIVFALQARKLTADQFRATISAVFAVSNLGAITAFALAGKVTRDGLTASALCVPALFAGQLLGHPIRRRVQGDRFRRLVLGLLLIVAVRIIIVSL